jgi:hypothetical protein
MSSTKKDDKQELKNNITEWNKYKNLINEYDKKMEKYKNKVISYMKENELETLITEDFIVKSSKCSRESISKQDLPKDIWNQYCKSSSYHTYKLTEK